MKQYLAGLNVPPALVAAFRGLVLAFVAGVISLAVSYLTSDAVPKDFAVYAPIVVYALRQIEGFLDQNKKPAQNDTGLNPNLKG